MFVGQRVRLKVAICCSFIFVMVMAGCTIAPEYNAIAYKNATDLKVESLDVMSYGTKSYSGYTKEVTDLKNELNKAYEYANGLPNNQITSAMWWLIKSPDQPLLGGYLELWRVNGRLGAAFVEEQKKQVSEAFDYLICLEANKKTLSKCDSKKPKEVS